ncbi:Homoserine kinase [compost metagenome]
MLKIAHPAEDLLQSNFQTEALLHIERRDPGLHVQRVVLALNGEAELLLSFEGQTRVVRMVTFMEGTLLRHAPVTTKQQRNMGAELARLGEALKDFDHPAADHVLLWDIQNAESLRSMFDVFDPECRAWMEGYLDTFSRDVKPLFQHMRKQIVHNDLNSDNALVQPNDPDAVAAILDFGDMVRTPLINDVVVAVAYALGEPDAMFEAPKAFLEGYQSVTPLAPEELDAFYDLLMTRMMLRLTLTEWRANRFPENKEYILRNNERTWRQFEKLRSMTQDEVEKALFGASPISAEAFEWRI